MVSKNAPSTFIMKLYDILDNDQNQQICWNNDGLTFIIMDQQSFTEKILSVKFKHSNFSSFIRQLNMYNFRKIRDNKKSQEFYHELFRKQHKELLIGIKRKPTQADIAEGKELLKKFSLEAYTHQLQIKQSKENHENDHLIQYKQIETLDHPNPTSQENNFQTYGNVIIQNYFNLSYQSLKNSRSMRFDDQQKTEIFIGNLLYYSNPVLAPNFPIMAHPIPPNYFIIPFHVNHPMVLPVPISDQTLDKIMYPTDIQN